MEREVAGEGGGTIEVSPRKKQLRGVGRSQNGAGMRNEGTGQYALLVNEVGIRAARQTGA